MATGRGIDPRSRRVVAEALGRRRATPPASGASDRFPINVSLFIERRAARPPRRRSLDEMQNRSELIDFSVLPMSLYRLVRRRRRSIRLSTVCVPVPGRYASDDDDDGVDDSLSSVVGREVSLLMATARLHLSGNLR